MHESVWFTTRSALFQGEPGQVWAEVAAYDDLAMLGDVDALRHAGKMRTEGKDYVVQDGDVIQFLFRT